MGPAADEPVGAETLRVKEAHAARRALVSLEEVNVRVVDHQAVEIVAITRFREPGPAQQLRLAPPALGGRGLQSSLPRPPLRARRGGQPKARGSVSARAKGGEADQAITAATFAMSASCAGPARLRICTRRASFPVIVDAIVDACGSLRTRRRSVRRRGRTGCGIVPPLTRTRSATLSAVH